MQMEVMIRADCKKKEGGKFVQLASWRIPPLDRTKWDGISGIIEPDWTMETLNYKNKKD